MDLLNKGNCLIVAELSANHNHDFDVALRTIEAAKAAGADAIKLQTYTPDTLTIDCRNEHFLLNHGTIWDGISLYDLYKEAYTPWEWHEPLKQHAEQLGLLFFSTPFDITATDFLEKLQVPMYKIASFEITDINLIKYVASKGKPMIISTGIATYDEIKEAVNACRAVGNNEITLLKCTSQYPADYQDANLNTMVDMKEAFSVNIGLSDHTMDNIVPITAVGMGATIIEKHFIIDRSIGGPDASFSLTPAMFKEMVDNIRKVEKIMGNVNYSIDEKISKNRVFARSLFVTDDMRCGEMFSNDNIRSIRPGNGLAPKYYEEIIGKKATCDIKKGTPLSWNLIK